MSKKGMKLGYGNYSHIDSALESEKIDARDIVITDDTSELLYIRDDLSKQLIRPRVQRFPNILTAINELNSAADTYAGAIVMVLNGSGEYEPYIVQNGTEGYELQPFPSITIGGGSGLVWEQF